MCLLALAAARVQAEDSDQERLLPEIGDERTEVTADRIEFEVEGSLYVASGNVRIRRGDQRLSSHWVAFSPETNRGVASGDVVLNDGPDLLEASFLQFDVDTLEGTLFDGKIDLGEDSFRIAAREFIRSGRDSYTVFDGRLTTCRCPDEDARDPWSLNAGRSDIEVGSYGRSLNTTIEVLGVPVFWLPWIMYPVKTDRQSGLLFPEISLGGRNGFEFGVPIFWAARDNVNAIYTPSWSQDRGFKNDFEIETVWGERSFSDLAGAYVNDKANDPAVGPRNGLFDQSGDHFGPNRWSVRVEHDQELPGDFTFRADIALASDTEYPLDFDDLGYFRRDRFIESTAFVSGQLGDDGRLGVVLATRYVDDQQNPNDRDRDDFVLQRWAEATLAVLPGPTAIPGLAFLAPSLSVDYVRFGQRQDPLETYGASGAGRLVSNNGVFLDTGIDALPDAVGIAGLSFEAADPNEDAHMDNLSSETNGFFDEGEPIADQGHRVVLHPRVQLPLRLFDVVEFSSEVGYRQSLYWSDRLGFREHGLITARSDLRTRMRGQLDLPGLEPLDHSLEPFLSWALVSQRGHGSQTTDPLYVPRTAVPQQRIRQLALENVVLDPADRVSSVNRIAFGFENRFYRRAANGRRGRLLADIVLSADVDFTGDGFGLLVLEGRTFPYRGVSTRFKLAVDPGAGRVSEGLASVNVPLPIPRQRQGRLEVAYRYLRDVPQFFEDFATEGSRFGRFDRPFRRINQIRVTTYLPVTRGWALRYRLQSSLEPALLLGQAGGVEYVSKCRCWAAGVELAQSRNRDLQVRILYTLLGPGQTANNPFAGGPMISPGAIGR